MRRYIQRSMKYFISRCCIFLMLLYALSYTTLMAFSTEHTFKVLTDTIRGYALITAILIFSATYPLYGFVTRHVRGDYKRDRELIIKLFEEYGMVLHHETEGRLTFVERNHVSRFLSLYEDHVKVIATPDEAVAKGGRGGLTFVGPRKRTARMAYIVGRTIVDNNN